MCGLWRANGAKRDLRLGTLRGVPAQGADRVGRGQAVPVVLRGEVRGHHDPEAPGDGEVTWNSGTDHPGYGGWKAAGDGFGERLRRIRVSQGLTQRELAETAGVFQEQVTNHELGRATPRHNTALRYALALGVPLPLLTALPEILTDIDTGGIGARMRGLREAAGLTQRQVGRIAGVTVSAVCKWEKSNLIPRLDHAVRVAAALGAPSLDWLVFGDSPNGDE